MHDQNCAISVRARPAPPILSLFTPHFYFSFFQFPFTDCCSSDCCLLLFFVLFFALSPLWRAVCGPFVDPPLLLLPHTTRCRCVFVRCREAGLRWGRRRLASRDACGFLFRPKSFARTASARWRSTTSFLRRSYLSSPLPPCFALYPQATDAYPLHLTVKKGEGEHLKRMCRTGRILFFLLEKVFLLC
ncbi:hypothetical protein ABB37_09986 [Leptomonas pyrrhocoris]|uniref:Uncharacterized protein n=1 Tax=Leptomonas pyrrhocoris TaxID=157538 RepID=A0A0N0VCR3_LEPPY|nr:hypothetical protein ABB37_09986 [Leptomonas pyrrhocoris]KPA73274.1 hypothetical protein ABB37_09986 [Leptomonas pyrrhocoris]|eukprot:XP_015651713.1 hypothetical protein ABB37_09986 [Leptomonas pyrrhocoris]